MSKYWLHYSQSAKWSHQSRTQPCTVVFFERSNIWPNPSVSQPSPQPVHFFLLCISACVALRWAQVSQSSCLVAVRPSRQFVWIGSWISKSSCSLRFPQGTYWLTPKMVRQKLSSHVPHPHLHICHQTHRTRLNESSLLTSSADKWDVTSSVALSANH